MSILFLACLVACERAEAPAPAPELVATALPVPAPPDLVASVGQDIAFEGTDLEIVQGPATVHIPVATGRFVPHGDFVDFGDPRSFDLSIDTLELRLPTQDLIAPYQESGLLRRLSVHTEGEGFVLEGGITPVGIPVTFEALPSVTEDGRVLLSLDRGKVLGIGVKPALLAALDAATQEKAGWIKVDGDELYIDVSDQPGMPQIEVRWSEALIEGDTLVLRAGSPSAPAEGVDGSFVLRGGTLRSGHTLLFDPVLTLIASDGGPLVVGGDTFSEQMQQGFTKPGAEGKITIHLVDPHDLRGDGVADGD